MDDPLDIVSVLADSPHRLPILQFVDGDPASVSEVSSALPIPRRTAKHNLSRLEEAGLVQSVGSEHSATTFGTYVCANVSACLDAVSVAHTLQPFLEIVPPSSFDFDPSKFEGSDVTAASSTAPHAPTERLLELVRDAVYLRVTTPVVGPRLADAFRDGLEDGDLELNLLAPRDALDLLQSRHPSVYEAAIDEERLVAGVYAGDVPFGLFLRDDLLVLVGHDEQNFVRCVVENDSPAALEWGSNVFRDREQRVESYVTGSDAGAEAE
jgi:predicted transcriptional regulator